MKSRTILFAAMAACVGGIPSSANADLDVVAVYYPHWHQYPKGTEWFGEKWNEGEWAGVKDGVAYLRERYYRVWEPALAKGRRVVCGEIGVTRETPQAAALGWVEDNLKLLNEYGMGYAFWSLIGGFGVLNNGRKGGMTIPCIATVGTSSCTVEATVRGRGGIFRKTRLGGTSWGVRVNAAGQAEAYFDRFAPGARAAGADTLVVTPAAGTGIVDDGTWHHVALALDRAAATPQATLFVDGEAVATCDISAMQMDGGDLKVGEDFTGEMLGLRFSPGVLAADAFLTANDANRGLTVILR